MKIHEGDFIVSTAELAAAAAVLEVDEARLSVVPPELWSTEEEHALRLEVNALDAADRDRFASAIATIAAPTRVASFHYTLADETVSRHLLAWPAGQDETGRDTHDGPLVFVAHNVDSWRIGHRATADIEELIARILAAREPIDSIPLGFELSAGATLVFLAVLDHLRAARLASQLTHQAPQTLLAAAAIAALLGTGTTEDFRSPFLFFEKLLPVALDTEPPEVEITAAFQELERAGLLEPADGTELFSLSELGEAAADSVFHEVSKVGLRLAECLPDGRVGHDTMLFIRSAFRLLLFEVDGPSGAVASLDGDEFAALIGRLLDAPGPDTVEASRAAAPHASEIPAPDRPQNGGPG